MQLVLASSSPARLTTLRAAGLSPVAASPAIDETAATGESVEHLTRRLATAKCHSVIERLSAEGTLSEPAVVVACDTLLEIEGHIYGKPGTPEAAIVRWYRMRGREGVIHTGHHIAVLRGGQRDEATRVASTVVGFADLTDAEIASYVATGEPQNVAGGFTIDGWGGPFVTGVIGDPHNVVGISLPLVRQMLLDLGVGWFDLVHDTARTEEHPRAARR
ncbi:Maf family protein [Propionibacterium cyclohexanicum]|nr:Maf family protein [Propionibacterium cyclohexanicum]